MRKPLLFFVLSSLILLFLYSAGCRRAGVWLVRDEMPLHADAMVILMGSFAERVAHGVDLYSTGKADRMIIVEESMGSYRELTGRGVPIISHSSQAGSAALKLGVPADSIILLPGDARSTLSEAMIVRKYLKDISSIDTIILVSSPAHLRRASIIFKNAFRNLPEPVFVGCSPSAYSSFSPDKWWRRKEDIQTVLTEYLKTGSFLLIEKRQLKSQ